MKNDIGWKKLNELRVTNRDYSGLQYSYKYAKKYKDRKALGGGLSDYKGRWTTVSIVEQIEIKEDKSGNILYRVVGKADDEKSYQEFHTQFGTYISDDCGEFGGSLVTPTGEKFSGNFGYMFDLKDKVYGIDTCAHLSIAHFNLFQFHDSAHRELVYSLGGLEQRLTNYIENKGIMEDLCCSAIDVKEDKAYLLLAGYVHKDDPDDGRRCWKEIRLLKIENDEVEEVVSLVGYGASYIKDVIVRNDTLFISCDKMVIKYDLLTKNTTYFTCLTEEDEADLLENERKK